MGNKSRWKWAHDKFPAHVEEAKNSDGTVHRGYFLLEFRVAAELLRVGPMHSVDDYWAPSDWQLLLVVSEYMSALLEFLDWFWPDLGWEHHKQAIVLSKRLLQPRSPNTYPELHIEPQLRAAWQSFTYCFWHGTRHLPAAPPSGEPSAAYNAAREWLTKLVGERGFEAEGHIVSSLQSWIQNTRPRLQDAFPSVDWSHWPAVVWPDHECAFRVVEKRGAVKRRQHEEDYAVRWPLRVTQGRPKFNHLKLEARDGFVVGIPSTKNPPALGFLAVSDVMCAFKQAAQHWPSTQVGSPGYQVQQDVVQNFVQNVLRETRGPLAPGVPYERYRYLGYVACSVLGWNSALSQLALPVAETAAWGTQPLALAGSATVLIHMQEHRSHHPMVEHQTRLHFGTVKYAPCVTPGIGPHLLLDHNHLDPGLRIDLGIAAQLAMQPELLMSLETEAALARQLPPVAAQLLPQVAGTSTAPWAATAMAAQGFDSLPLSTAVNSPPQLAGQPNLPPWTHGGAAQPPTRPDLKATRPRPSPFLARTASGRTGTAGNASTSAASPTEAVQQRDSPAAVGDQQVQEQPQRPQQQHVGFVSEPVKEGGQGGRAEGVTISMDGSAPMSLGGLSSMQDLIDGLPSQTDLTWSAIMGAVVGEDVDADAGASTTAVAGPSGPVSELMAALPSLLLPSWAGQRPPSHPQSTKLQEQARVWTLPTEGPSPLGLHPFDTRVHYGEMLEQPPVPPRHAPDAPVHVQLPSGATSPCQATITTGVLPSFVLPSLTLASHGLPSLALPSSGLSRPELSCTESKPMRRSHGEVSTLSPVASCGQIGEVVPCSPAPTVAGAVAVDEEAGAAGAGAVARTASSFTRDKDGPAAMLPAGNRRTRQDVADAAAAAAADQGLDPAPGSAVERCAKRSYSQVGRPAMITAARVESLGAFLTDQQAGLPDEQVAVKVLPGSSASPSMRSASDGADKMALARQLLQLLRAWAEEGRNRGLEEGTALTAAADAEVHRRAEELLAQGAPVDMTDDSGASASETSGTAGYTALHWACLRGDVALVELLLRHGADPERPDATGTPARLVNTAFTATLAEVAARCAAQRTASVGDAITANTARPGLQVPSSVFASAAGVAALQDAVNSELTAHQLQLRNRLAELLRSADQIAAQLAMRDPQTAASEVLQAMRDTEFLYRCVVSGAAAAL